MSAPPEKIQKPRPLLLQGIAPHLFQSRKPLRKRYKPMDHSASSHRKESSGSSESTTSAALEAYRAAQLEIETLKAVIDERDKQIGELRTALDAAHVQLNDAARQIGTIAGIQAASAGAIDQLMGFLQGVVSE
ncbi:hypothetical protein B0H13DRAFT_2316355 [Mycena leptocephala]|nr:hypothetical protein B0H13DRAFT_2316355 [Mycena leptocephala]